MGADPSRRALGRVHQSAVPPRWTPKHSVATPQGRGSVAATVRIHEAVVSGALVSDVRSCRRARGLQMVCVLGVMIGVEETLLGYGEQ